MVLALCTFEIDLVQTVAQDQAIETLDLNVISGNRNGSESSAMLISNTLVAGAWTEREKMYHGGSFLKLADDNMDIQNPEAQNRAISGF